MEVAYKVAGSFNSVGAMVTPHLIRKLGNKQSIRKNIAYTNKNLSRKEWF